MSDNRINTLCRIDQSIRGLNEDTHDDSYIPAQSENGALERINKSIQNLDIKGIKNSYKVLQTGEGHAEDYPMLISPNYQFKPSIRDKVFFEASITYNPVAQGMKIASHNDGPGEHVKMRAPFASIHEDNPQPAFIELGTSSVKSTLKKDDLVLTGEGNTWDGEHGSLKEALALKARAESIYANDFAEHFDECALKDVLYLVDGSVEPYTRFNESIESSEEAQNKVYAWPVNPSVIIMGYEPWMAFSDNAEHGFSTVYDESDGSSLQYVFDYPQHVRAISFKLKYETNLDEPPTIPVEIYIEVHDGHQGWKDRTLLFRGSIDEDFEFTWYAPTSAPLSITDSIRFINTSPLSDNLTYVVSIANIQLFDASSELDTGDKSIWYKGEKFGNVSEGGSGGPTRTVLYEPPAGTVGELFDAQNDMLTLSDDVRNYDEIIIIPATTEGNNDFYCTGEQTFRTADLLIPATQRDDLGMGIRFRAFRTTGNEEAAVRLVLDNQTLSAATPYQTLWCEGATGIYGPYIRRVIGVKY